jgi:hypothetical protein
MMYYFFIEKKSKISIEFQLKKKSRRDLIGQNREILAARVRYRGVYHSSSREKRKTFGRSKVGKRFAARAANATTSSSQHNSQTVVMTISQLTKRMRMQNTRTEYNTKHFNGGGCTNGENVFVFVLIFFLI